MTSDEVTNDRGDLLNVSFQREVASAAPQPQLTMAAEALI
jgi:hypothetical protein